MDIGGWADLGVVIRGRKSTRSVDSGANAWLQSHPRIKNPGRHPLSGCVVSGVDWMEWSG